ncbi:MAG: bifunctional hydroxymethylpyrimidine kinase/phosphomethylpyrimidine kinase [Sphingomonadaceae bacterium]|nr:bifunctional hydroxymethylpyrimidine kinase/phosphomethylpyrimidine kinase [Sphingomonadaceae bacterium]
MAGPPRILSIAGSDSSGGAGIQADIKTITMLGGYAMTAVTAVTAQDTNGVHAIETVSPELVAGQIEACVSDIGVNAVKIGMLGSAGNAHAVADVLEGIGIPVVFDPVMAATSGSALADEATIAAFERLMQLATLTTPNVAEFAVLGGDDAMRSRKITYLAKGGDAPGNVIEDRLVRPGEQDVIWRAERIDTRHTHGTGCTLSSAIATYIGGGLALPDAIDKAQKFVRAALENAPGFGSGHGPMGHQAVKRE